ncbi:MAG: hypothetical protein PHH26_01390 [Candidatus Thermoplasmatota archaeon]|nr:hypothetical protein [Candidatus Thermoplasmatota archaeon]
MPVKSCPNLEENKKSCPCTWAKQEQCPRWGKCCECVRYHRSKGETPACL